MLQSQEANVEDHFLLAPRNAFRVRFACRLARDAQAEALVALALVELANRADQLSSSPIHSAQRCAWQKLLIAETLFSRRWRARCIRDCRLRRRRHRRRRCHRRRYRRHRHRRRCRRWRRRCRLGPLYRLLFDNRRRLVRFDERVVEDGVITIANRSRYKATI